MIKQKSIALVAALFCFSLCLVQADKSLAQEKDIAVADVIAKHVDSIGKPEARAKVKSRGITGKATFRFVQGMTGSNNDGTFMCLSEGKNLGLTMKFNDLTYPGEYLAYNGKEATVKDMMPGRKSPLADFVFRFNAVMKEGFLGGVLSTGWPLPSHREGQLQDFTYKLEQLGDRKYHVLEKKSGDIRIRLFFETGSFRHVRTEYAIRLKNDTSANSSVQIGEATTESLGIDTSVQGKMNPRAPQPTIRGAEPDSIFTLVEKFDRFTDVGGLSIPAAYSIEYSAEGHGTPFVGEWNIFADRWINNGAKIDQSFFVAK